MTITLDTARAYLEPRAQELASRIVRQEFQALTPTLVVLAGGTAAGVDVPSLFWLIGVTGLVTVLTYLGKLTVGPNAPAWEQVAERATKAAVGTAFGYITLDGFTAAAVIPWGTTVTAALGSAGIAITMYFTNPPVVARATSSQLDDAEPASPASSTYRQPTDGDLFG